jgi:HlyD family secretion protein
MNTKIFRKTSIDRLSSPEELDQVIRISAGGSWAALLGIVLFCTGATVWAVTSELPTTAVGSGLIVRSGGVLNVVARGAGVVQGVDATVGQHVSANQVIARIGQPVLSEHVRSLRDSLEEIARKRQQSLQLKRDEVAMRMTALSVQRSNIERSIGELNDQAALAADQIPVMEQLFAKGLVTNQQVIATRQRRIELLGQASDRRAQLSQLESQELELRNETTTLDQEIRFDLASRQREIAAATSELTLQETVTTPYAGDILEIKVSPGGTVAAGTPILSIQPDSSALEALIYVSALQAKDIRVGMDARVSPSTVKREEYGFLQGKVSFVADYPATAAAVMRNFQNEQLVQALTAAGPITEIHVALERDPSTTSGFKWSSRGGPPVTISAGTFTIIEVVTRTRAPISLVVPMLRETLGL